MCTCVPVLNFYKEQIKKISSFLTPVMCKRKQRWYDFVYWGSMMTVCGLILPFFLWSLHMRTQNTCSYILALTLRVIAVKLDDLTYLSWVQTEWSLNFWYTLSFSTKYFDICKDTEDIPRQAESRRQRKGPEGHEYKWNQKWGLYKTMTLGDLPSCKWSANTGCNLSQLWYRRGTLDGWHLLQYF